MATKLDICSPGEFAVLGEQTNLAKAWEQYMKRFEYYIRAAGITKDEQKRDFIVTCQWTTSAGHIRDVAGHGNNVRPRCPTLNKLLQTKEECRIRQARVSKS